MDFTISSSLLYKHLAGASRIVAGKSTMPILENVLFTVESNQLRMLVTDLETTLLTTIPLENVRREGAIGVPLRILLDTLKEFPDMPLNFSVHPNSLKIQVDYNVGTRKGEFSVMGQHTDDFPELPELVQDQTTEFTTSTEVFLAGISHTSFAAGKPDLAPHLAGVLIEVKPERLRFVATDHNRVACATRKDIRAEADRQVFLPIRPASLLNAILPHDEDELQVAFDNRNIRLTTSAVQLICRLTETNFPPYESVIPYENPFELSIDRVVFHNALKQVSPFSDRGRNLVTFALAQNKLTISAKNPDNYNEAYQEIECSYSGDALEVSFNTLHLTEALANIAAQEVVINFSPNTRSSLLRPTIDESEHDELLMVIAQAHR